MAIRYDRFDIIFDPDLDDMIEKVGDALQSSGAFSAVDYMPEPRNDSYHIAFTFHAVANPLDTGMAAAFLSGYSLLLIPIWLEWGLDCSATLYLKNKPIYGTAGSEELKCYIWLPLAPVGLLWNNYFAMNRLEDGIINKVVNSITTEHMRRFGE